MRKLVQKQLFRIFFAGIISGFVFWGTVAPAAGQADAKKPGTSTDYIEVIAKVLTVDPIKGDVSARLEFVPHGKFSKEDGTLAKTVKLDINSSNGKQEVTFDRGKRMTPTEAVLNMYDGAVTDYPFDSHKADLIFWFSVKPDKTKEKPAERPKAADDAATTDVKPETQPTPEVETDDDGEIDVPFTLDFTPTMAGYSIESVKSKDSDETYVDIQLSIVRSSMVKFFSVFVMVLMWGVSIAVLLLVLSVVVKGRKIEIAMFSFIATLLFAFVALRNSQPAVPPIGTLSDYMSFFGAEVILALSLLTIVFTWLLRPAAK